MGNENTHIANACNTEIQIFFESRKLHIQEIAIDATVNHGVSVKESVQQQLDIGASVSVLLKPDTRIQYLRCPSREYIKIPLQGQIYVTIIAKRESKNELMCMNFLIPTDRSIIAINNGLIKFAEYGSLWKDEDGHYY